MRRPLRSSRLTSVEREGSLGRVGSSKEPWYPAAFPNRRQSSCICRWPVSVGSSVGSRPKAASNASPSWAASRYQTSSGVREPWPHSIALSAGREMPTLLASRFCVSCLRRRAPRNWRPFLVAACSASRDPASRASSRRPVLERSSRTSTFRLSTSAPLSKSGLHHCLARRWVSVTWGSLPDAARHRSSWAWRCGDALGLRVPRRGLTRLVAAEVPVLTAGLTSAGSSQAVWRPLPRADAPAIPPPDEIYDQSRRGVPPAHSNWLICACGIPRAFCARVSRVQRALRAVP